MKSPFRTPSRIVGLAILVACVSPLTGTAQEQVGITGSALATKVDSLAESVLADGLVSGFSIGVEVGGEIVLTRGYGFADLENRAAADHLTVYSVGSLTKQFTAAAIMQLVDEGRVDLDETIDAYLADFDTQGRSVTVRQLLSHTSGVRSYPSDDTPLETLPLDRTNEELRSLIQAEPFDFEPGTSWRYSNAGYLLLGMIASEVTGLPYREVIARRLFEPTGMDSSRLCDAKQIVPGRADGYDVEGFELVRTDYLSMSHAGAAGAACSTVVDLLRWSIALRNGDVVSPPSYDRMIAPTMLDGRAFPYGFGLRPQDRLEGTPVIWHGGGINGFSSQLDHYPDRDITIVVLSNTYGAHVRKTADIVARWMLGIPQPVRLDRPTTAGQLRRYSGGFQSDDGQLWLVSEVGGRLFAAIGDGQPFRLRWQGDDSFAPSYSDFAIIDFEADSGVATGFTIDECVPTAQERCRTRVFQRIR